ncbi:MAG TPA: SDR family NAD(P)-dependent oxidoreductase [Stellaceae bacterium]|nr:SDR family NAD(P)-dependent oxidoreductase [Stellaceae bacterium]
MASHSLPDSLQEVAKTAVVIGASSGIGEAIARRLAKDGWRLGLAARRLERLGALAADLETHAIIRHMDLAEPEKAALALDDLIDCLGTVDLIVISSGTGHINPDLDWSPDKTTLTVNVLGFAAVAQVAMRHFIRRGAGHLVGISSIMALRGAGRGAAYAASKAFVSTYLDGLRDLARQKHLPITVTEAQPGFVNTAMMKTNRPFWVASPDKAAKQILAAVHRRAKHAYITKRWGIVALRFKLSSRPG